jgi:hypothetical protein
MERNFDEDNFFIFDRSTWNSILEKKIILESGCKWVKICKNERKKIKNKNEINFDLKSLDLIRNYQRTSIMDVITENRVTEKYIQPLEKYKMDQRINGLKEWIISIVWKGKRG